VFLGLLVIEIDRSGRALAVRIVALAAWLVPKRLRANVEDEWRDHVLSAGEEGLRPVAVALSIALRAAPRLAVRYRLRRRAARFVGGLLSLFLRSAEAQRAELSVQPNVRSAHFRHMAWADRWRIGLMALRMYFESMGIVYAYLLTRRRAGTWPRGLFIVFGAVMTLGLVPLFFLAPAGVVLGAITLNLVGHVACNQAVNVFIGRAAYAERLVRRVAGLPQPD
jgi:hypothetical protein